MKEVLILEEAVTDLKKSKEFYNRQDPGIGNYFINEILSEIQELESKNGVHLKQFNYFRKLSKKFPYAIYYYTANEKVFVIAILDLRQNPTDLSNTLSNR